LCKQEKEVRVQNLINISIEVATIHLCAQNLGKAKPARAAYENKHTPAAAGWKGFPEPNTKNTSK
jgi:hypothetical protein